MTKKIETDFSKIISGRVYGTNSRKIYEKFCETLGWDRSKANQFGQQKTPLYAANADANRINDIWFICYPNYDANAGSLIDINGHNNIIKDNGDKIIEVVADKIGASNNANRITFVKTNNGYEFLGVYEIVENGTTRIFKQISKTYPID